MLKEKIMAVKSTKHRSTAKLAQKKPTNSGFLARFGSQKFMALAFVVVFAGIGSYLLLASHAATIPLINTEAEAMTLPSGTTIIADTTASGGQAIQFGANGTATTTINLPSPADSLAVTARGVQCKGSPTMVTKLDGVQVGSSNVSATSWTSYSYTKALASGSHTLSFSFTNYSTWKNCGKKLLVDKAVFMGTAPVTPPLAASDLMNRKDFIYGSEIGAWRQDGKPAIDLTTNIPNLVKAAQFPIIRFAMYDCFEGMTCGTDNHAGTQTKAKFDTAIDGIRNNLNAEPLFKLLPIAPDLIGYPTEIDGNKFCPPTNNLAMNLPLYKAVVDQAGSRIRLYESTNEGEV
ncbi:MAG TPA: carbohydrate-binding domain-containing protein, partial [Candidatus Limnocylindrales bacterium]|nr:carbohydrate-binding domain-containing protein [Candidatus Limnocylindrales bacterium]